MRHLLTSKAAIIDKRRWQPFPKFSPLKRVQGGDPCSGGPKKIPREYLMCTFPKPRSDVYTYTQDSLPSSKPITIVNPIETRLLLQLAATKLAHVQKQRYTMLQKAKIEACYGGLSLDKIEKEISWHDFSRCPRKYAF